MQCAGFLLVGGKSLRMGQDKALLPFDEGTLLQHLGVRLHTATSRLSLVGDPQRYGQFGFPVIRDNYPDAGPLGGIEAALRSCQAPWNIIVACDMPAVPYHFLQRLANLTETSRAQCIVPRTGYEHVEPLCAAYHRSCLVAVSRALAEGRFAIKNLLRELQVTYLTDCNPDWFINVNTPRDWQLFQRSGLRPAPPEPHG